MSLAGSTLRILLLYGIIYLVLVLFGFFEKNLSGERLVKAPRQLVVSIKVSV